MKHLLSIMAEPVIIVFAVLAIFGIIYGVTSYSPGEITYWFEESHLVCKEVKAAGFNAKVDKKCYILDYIEEK